MKGSPENFWIIIFVFLKILSPNSDFLVFGNTRILIFHLDNFHTTQIMWNKLLQNKEQKQIPQSEKSTIKYIVKYRFESLGGKIQSVTVLEHKSYIFITTEKSIVRVYKQPGIIWQFYSHMKIQIFIPPVKLQIENLWGMILQATDRYHLWLSDLNTLSLDVYQQMVG